MGSNHSTQSKMKNDIDTPCVETFFRSPRFRFAFKMKATQDEAEKLNDKWTDFTSRVTNEFVYFTDTPNSPQYIKVSRNGDKLQFNVSTTIDLENDDIEKLTDMFTEATGAIRKYHSRPTKLGLAVTEKTSAVNLLALDK